MTKRTQLFKRITALLLAVTILAASLPAMLFSAAGASANIVLGEKVADLSTMDSWQQLFPADNTAQAGRIWTDKSVFVNADAFQALVDADGEAAAVTMMDADNHFLVALSALASNKSIIGYSYMPTDTMLVLDASGSMSDQQYVDDLVTAANDAIKKLLSLNKHNRIGVVLYSGNADFGNSGGSTATVLLPLDRYTQSYAGIDRVWQEGERKDDRGEWVDVPVDEKDIFLKNDGQSSISVNRGVQNAAQQGTDTYMPQSSKSVNGGTYIQNGVYMAMEEFLATDDTAIPDNEVQAGTTRTPIFVLMSDGEPTTATTHFAGRTAPQTVGIGTSNLGDGGTVSDSTLATVVDFVNQLTAAYVTAQVDAHYQKTVPLFYTLGLGSNNANLNSAVLNPTGFTHTDTLWNSYVNTADNSGLLVDIEQKKNRGETAQASITKVSQITATEQKNYVTAHFSAGNAAGLISAFDKIVNQIIIQSLYYPTLVNDGAHDHDGFIEFLDDIGHYMDVKDIKGILIGDTLFTGERLAKNFIPSGGELIDSDGNYTVLGDNMVRSVMQRIGIASAQDARDLINNAYTYDQLRYHEDTGEWSNYIGWYANDDGEYLGFWHEGHTAADIPTDPQTGEKATYINRSYGMLGEVDGEHADTDLMYISTQIHTRIADNNSSMIWRIPASLIPVVSYNITLNGENLIDATAATIAYDAAEPIRLLFEVGLSDDIHLGNITEQVIDRNEHILDENGDGISDNGKYYFYTNWWNDDNLSHENPSKVQDTIVFFEPSLQNERYYYAEETAVLVANGNTFERYKGTMPAAGDGNTYYREYIVFEGTGEGGVADIVRYHEPMSDATVSVLKPEHQNVDGTWDIPSGTVHRVLEPYNLEKADKTLTATLDYVRYPVIEAIPEKDSFYIGSLLGNNGRIAVDIPQGIKLAKTVDDTLYGTTDTYFFTIEAAVADGDTQAYLEAVDGTLAAQTVTFTSGVATVSLKAGEALYLPKLAADTDYTVTEQINGEYMVRAVTVNGELQPSTAAATVSVEQHTLTTVVFENTREVTDGTLVINKEVVHDAALAYNTAQEFTFEWYNKDTPDDKHTFSIKEGETELLDNLAFGTYVVHEINIPAGYTPRQNPIEVVVADDATVAPVVHFVNEYTPSSVKPVGLVVTATRSRLRCRCCRAPTGWSWRSARWRSATMTTPIPSISPTMRI